MARYELRPTEAVTVYRIVASDNEEDPVFLRSFRSSYELGHPPRKIQKSSSIFHMGMSVYLDEDAAHGTAQRWEKLGDWVVRLDLEDGHGFNYAHTGFPGHLTIWGDPIKLSKATAEVKPVQR